MTLVYPQLVTGADLLRGIIKLNELAPLLKSRGATVASIVNSKLYGVRTFSKVLKRHGIQPVIGLSVNLNIGEERNVLVYIYAQNDIGYHNLMKISSAISVGETEILPLQWLKAYGAGCSIICPMTDTSWGGLRNDESIRLIKEQCKQSNVFIGVARPGGQIHAEENAIENIAETTSISITAVYESRFIRPEDSFAYEVATAIRTGEKMSEVTAQKEELYKFAFMPTEEELHQWFTGKEHWLHNTASFLQSCNVEVTKEKSLMPVFPVPQNQDSKMYLREKCLEGLNERLDKVDQSYLERLDYELTIIKEMGFTDYFLIVEDFIRFSAENNILTGPGRGSSAGSLVAFALHITDVDPIRYGLIFERFLNPERKSMPDIDIDFADNRRMEVLHYVTEKYGKNFVAQIITFGTLSARSVARNVARVFGFSTEEMAYLSSVIPNRSKMTLERAFEESSNLRDWIAMDLFRRQWFDAANSLEGLPRNASTHAAGVVLSPKPLVETVPLQDGGDGIYLTQWPMNDVEEQGLLKMDFLGLRNLTLLDRIRRLIRKDKGVIIDFEKIPLNDIKTFEVFKRGDTSGVFQFESDGMRDTLRLIQPNRFEDIFAINALYRPGPMDNIPLYNNRKHGKEKITYIHPSLEPILKETYGVIVYQEQIMQIAVKFAGYTMGEADLLRRAVSKKNREVLQHEREKFTQSAMNHGVPKQDAVSIYELIVKFADYGFPKSHAVAYSLISYRLAYLKANEPAYFYAALLSSMMGSNEKTIELIEEAKAYGIQILPPSIKRSEYFFTVEKSAVRIGLGSIRGVTQNFYTELFKARNNGATWKTMFDVAANLGSDVFNEKVISPLIKAGAFDEFGETRATLLASIDAAISHAMFIGPNDSEDLLTSIIPSIANPKYTDGGKMPRMIMLEYEREVLGFYLSEHPALQLKKDYEGKFMNASSISTMRDREHMIIIGLITEVKRIRTKKGESMAFVSVQDETGTVSCTFFPRNYAESNPLLTEMAMIRVEGTVETRRGKPQILVQKAFKI
ncbi:DNA polymerase III subunit alpha [Sporosarcina sp. Marseille-Q4063]|uniref:DNA polymerase III subunit alpha n=1 Tax=Sporosarcina sp. Marseille-Q4063 TaxID=2810514 RepID=UPI001BAF796A|nr:DNA polymerase III subunit alpha [Sporosarcina sp. Marseille-Q4063]QUW22704.1 DNA polymerase III subunit alpha [Sporosarcina sp. Marseille-Q4063]